MDADTLKRGPTLRSQPTLAPDGKAQRSAKVSSLLSSMSEVSPSLPPSLPTCTSPGLGSPSLHLARLTRLVSDENAV